MDPRDEHVAKLQQLHKPAAIPVISRSTVESECIWDRRDRLNAQALKREEQRLLRASQQVQDVFADRLHQRPLAHAHHAPVPPWQEDTQSRSSDQRPTWARPKPTIRMPRSMEVKPFQGYCLPQWSTPKYHNQGDGREKNQVEKAEDFSTTGPSSEPPESSEPQEPDATNFNTSRAEVRQLMNRELELEKLGDELRADRELVEAAVHADGHALQYASEALKADRDLVLAAVRENGLALQHAAQELRGDEDVALTAVKQNGLALQHTTPQLRHDSHPVLLAALAQNPQVARFVPRELLDDRDFVIAATGFSRRIFEKASFRLKRDLDVVLEVVEHDPECFMFAAWELRCDRQSVKEVVSAAGCAIAHASAELKQDPEILAVAIANDPMARVAAQS